MLNLCNINITEIMVVVVAMITAGLIFWSAIISRKTLKHQRLSSLRQEYRSEKMERALNEMRNFVGTTPEETVKKYKDSPVKDKDAIRRQTSHFFKELADLYADHVLRSKKFIFNIWPEPDLRIIKEAVIPIDDSIREERDRGKLPKDNNLWKLYLDAEAWANKKKQEGGSNK